MSQGEYTMVKGTLGASLYVDRVTKEILRPFSTTSNRLL